VTSAGLLDAFAEWSAEGKALVLASVYETEGSTYSKAGARMLITGDGRFHGMLSGGCLEGDLAERARRAIDTGQPQAVTYDLGKNDEELWGLGVGCDGLMRIFLQPLSPANDYEPFATMARALAGDTGQVAATVIESALDDIVPGTTLVTVDGELAYLDVAEEYLGDLGSLVGETLLEGRSTLKSVNIAGKDVRVLAATVTPPPSILVLGAGLDAGPVVRFASELGWRVTVQDHRPAYIESGEFSAAVKVSCVPVDELAAKIELDRFAAVIVMSHHLASDRSYLAQLARTNIGYIGLLGPVDRRRRLIEELGDLGKRLGERVHGPAGIDIGGRGPAAIALSIIAEMHRHLMADDQDWSS
jgi:xanthine/CO dehydrogenase XdhC/CoxF family maturation factor